MRVSVQSEQWSSGLGSDTVSRSRDVCNDKANFSPTSACRRQAWGRFSYYLESSQDGFCPANTSELCEDKQHHYQQPVAGEA